MRHSAPQAFPMVDWSGGWDNISTSIGLSPRCVSDCRNFNLTAEKGLQKRGGVAKITATVFQASTQIHSLYEYRAPNTNVYILGGGGTYLKHLLSDTWTPLKSALTSGKRMTFAHFQDSVFIGNGFNDNMRVYNTLIHKVGIAPPAAKPTVADGGAGTLTGKYRYVYVYRRTTAIFPPQFEGNPSPVSDEINVTSKKITVGYVASTDPQVNKIGIYRTLDLLGEEADSTSWFFVVEVANATNTYDDETDDDDLGNLAETDNDVPYKAQFIKVHKGRVYYSQCPDEDFGESLTVWSKGGIGEAIEPANFAFFDKGDGQPITGNASLGDYFVSFKRNKLAVLDIEKKEYRIIDTGIGCIASWAIIELEDKVIFLSEEGWIMFDGQNILNISSRIEGLAREGYLSENEIGNYSAVYYPKRKHFQFLMNHTSLPPIVTVGHFLIPLAMTATGATLGVPEEKQEQVVAWTYHGYEYHTLSCLGSYTDSSGIQRIMAGTSTGYLYLLDEGSVDMKDNDDAGLIDCRMATGWTSLGTPQSVTKTIRRMWLDYITNADIVDGIQVIIDADFTPDFLRKYVTGTTATYCGYCWCGFCYCGIDGSLNERIDLRGKGKLFKLNIYQKQDQDLIVLGAVIHFRPGNIR